MKTAETRGRPPASTESRQAAHDAAIAERQERIRAAEQTHQAAIAKVNHRLSARKLLTLELDALPEHAHRKVARLTSTTVTDWAASLRGQAGDPTPIPSDAAVAFLLGHAQLGDEFKAFLAAVVDDMAADPHRMTYTSRTRKEIEADIAKADDAIEQAKVVRDKALEDFRAASADLDTYRFGDAGREGKKRRAAGVREEN